MFIVDILKIIQCKDYLIITNITDLGPEGALIKGEMSRIEDALNNTHYINLYSLRIYSFNKIMDLNQEKIN